jgi:large subunit ribosomal protein L9
MKVILQERVPNLGTVGDLVTVKTGYARNFLVPHGKALQATTINLAVFEERRAELEQRASKLIGKSQKRADVFTGKTITLMARASDEGKLFGSVAAREIVDALCTDSATVALKEVMLPDGPIRQVGEYDVSLLIDGTVTTQVKVVVEAEV